MTTTTPTAAQLTYSERMGAIARANETGPEVGMVATFNCGSDRYPVVIASVSKSQHRLVTETGHTFTRRENGVYRSQGSKRGMSLTLGVSDAYYDPSF